MGFMLTISADILPQTCLSYFAFRVSFCETLERVALAKQIGEVRSGKSRDSSDQKIHIGAPEMVAVGREFIARRKVYSNVDENTN